MRIVPDLEDHLVESPVKKELFESPFEDRTYLFFLGAMFLTALVFMQLLYTLPVYLKQDLFYNEDQIGYLMAMNGLLIFFFEMPIIFLYEKKYNNMTLAAFGAFLVGLSFFVFNPLANIAGVAIVAMVLITFGEIFNFPFANDFAIAKTNAKNRGKYMGLYTMTFSGATIIAPTMGLYIAQQFGFAQLWYLIAFISLISAAGFFMLRKTNA